MSRRMGWGKLYAKIWGHGLDLLFPPVCILCNAPTYQAGLVCSGCFEALKPVQKPFCVRCATPQPSSAYLNASECCAQCEKHPPAWSYARAAFLYEGTARQLVLQLKYADRLEHARFLSERLCSAGYDIISSHSLIVPVPSHWRRRLMRRYNQAAILARAVSRRTGCAYMPDILSRPYPTHRLSGFSRRERYSEMAGAIAVKPQREKSIVGQHVVLVDDLLTSGATATACVRALLDSGAKSVSLLVVALVPRQKESDLDLPLSDTI